MAAQALYRKWRPATFDQVVGQEHITQTLRNALAHNRISHAYLMTGPRGTGKTTTARLLAKAVNCLAPDPADRPCNACAPCIAVNEGRLLDLIEIDAASNRGIDNIRELRDKIAFAPSEGRYKVYIIDEVHMLTPEAFNALLKTLEEPPEHAIFVLATTEVHKVPATVLSRCQRFDFRRLTVDQIVGRLEKIAAEEGRTVDPAALYLVARNATGAMRDAESLLDQLWSATVGEVSLAQAQRVLGTAPTEEVQALVNAWIDSDMAAGLAIINRAIDQGADPRQFARQMVDYLRELLLVRLSSSALGDSPVPVQDAKFQMQAARCERRWLIEAVKRFNEALNDTRGGWQPQLPLELAFVESVMTGEQAPPVAVAASIAPARPPAVEAWPAMPTPPSTSTAEETPILPEPAAPELDKAPPQPEPVAAPPAEPVVEQSIPAPAGNSASAEPSWTIDIVRARWKDILAVIKAQDRNAEPLLYDASPVAIQGHMVVIGFKFPAIRSLAEKPARKASIAAGVSTILGSNIQVQFTDGLDLAAPAGVAPDPVMDDDDPVVRYAVQQEGAVVRPNAGDPSRS